MVNCSSAEQQGMEGRIYRNGHVISKNSKNRCSESHDCA